jgi:hypothetical protein
MSFNLLTESQPRASREPVQLNHLQPAESQPRSTVSSQPQFDRVQPVESQHGSTASSQSRASTARLRPASREPAEILSRSIISSQLKANPARSSPASREPNKLNRLQPAPARSRPASLQPAPARSRLASLQPAKLDHLQPVESQHSSTASSPPSASRDPVQLDHLQPAESQSSSIISSQPSTSPARSRPSAVPGASKIYLSIVINKFVNQVHDSKLTTVSSWCRDVTSHS